MNDLSPIAQAMCNSIDVMAESIENAAIKVDQAGSLALNSLLNDRKIILCGNGFATPLTALLTTSLMHQQSFERPSLPAINISTDSTTISAIAADGNYDKALEKQIRAIGQDGDCLIALSINGNCENIVHAIQVAQEQNIKVIVLNGQSTGKLSALELNDGVAINLDTSNVAHATETMLLIVNALCKDIESKLFGLPLN